MWVGKWPGVCVGVGVGGWVYPMSNKRGIVAVHHKNYLLVKYNLQ